MLVGVLEESLMISGFVCLMMLVIEYTNVLTKGRWRQWIGGNRLMQYCVAAILGATPGCLGAFAVVALYSHGLLSLGALVAAMIATSGDEAFVMLALFPEQALLLIAILMIVGLITGWLTDVVGGRWFPRLSITCDRLRIHAGPACRCFPRGQIIWQLRNLSPARGILIMALVLFMFALLTGAVGPAQWNWIRVTLLGVSLAGIFIVGTVPEHFLREHLWNHVVRGHIHRVFLWTFSALIVTWFVTHHLHLEAIIRDRPVEVLMIAGLVGIIPESGPHLLFATLFAKGVVSFDVLLTSSIVQDGHGMLPLLAHSRKVFGFAKAINLASGILVGLLFHFAAEWF